MARHKQESPANRGARYEMIVAADMMRQGFEVFRALSPAGEVDLIGRKRGQLVLTQCKSEIGRAGIRRCDCLAVVSDGVIRYRVTTRRVARLFEEARVIRKVSPKFKQ